MSMRGRKRRGRRRKRKADNSSLHTVGNFYWTWIIIVLCSADSSAAFPFDVVLLTQWPCGQTECPCLHQRLHPSQYFQALVGGGLAFLLEGKSIQVRARDLTYLTELCILTPHLSPTHSVGPYDYEAHPHHTNPSLASSVDSLSSRALVCQTTSRSG